MNLGITGKRALVTGASKGLGENIAYNLAKEGVHVAIVARNETELKRVLDSLPGTGHKMIVADLMKKDAPTQVIKQLQSEFGELDIVVNNVGGTLEHRDPYCSLDAWQDMFRLNMEIMIEINNLVIPRMKEQQWGRIVNISSIAGSENQGPVPYCSMKAAVNAYSRSMGRILAPDGIIMCAVSPGAIMTKDGYWDYASKHKKDHVDMYLRDRMAIHRFGKPDEIGIPVTFLCSQHASFFVGSIVPIDGGQGRTFF